MLVIGLTGGIATGKTTVSSLLKSANVPVIDADLLAREVVAPGTPALAQIAAAFGPTVLLPSGALDRPALGAVIFADAAKRRALNAIVHPAVRRAMARDVLRLWWRGEKMCVVDVPLLIESKLYRFVAKVVVVYCSSDLQLRRLMKRDGSTPEAASARLNAQLPIAQKVDYADYVVDNSGSLQDLEDQVHGLLAKLHTQAGWSWRVSWFFPPWALWSAAWTLAWAALRRRRKLRSRKHT